MLDRAFDMSLDRFRIPDIPHSNGYGELRQMSNESNKVLCRLLRVRTPARSGFTANNRPGKNLRDQQTAAVVPVLEVDYADRRLMDDLGRDQARDKSRHWRKDLADQRQTDNFQFFVEGTQFLSVGDNTAEILPIGLQHHVDNGSQNRVLVRKRGVDIALRHSGATGNLLGRRVSKRAFGEHLQRSSQNPRVPLIGILLDAPVQIRATFDDGLTLSKPQTNKRQQWPLTSLTARLWSKKFSC
jgi:hypothetical protein